MNFSIIIPILNEEKNILSLVKSIKKEIKNIVYEVIFVDDNSQDKSKFLLEQIKNKKFKYLIRKKKRDLTQSCIDGIKRSKYENIVVMDGDLQHDPKCLAKMIKVYKKNNISILIGIRNFEKKNSLNFLRKWSSKFLIFFINYTLKKKTKDPMSGFFIIKKNIFYKSKPYLYGKGFKILSDILYSLDIDIKIRDYKINFKKRNFEKSKMNFFVLFHIMKMIIIKFCKRRLTNIVFL